MERQVVWRGKTEWYPKTRGGSRKERTGFGIRRYRFEVQQCDLSQGTLKKAQFSYSRYEMVLNCLRTYYNLCSKCLVNGWLLLLDHHYWGTEKGSVGKKGAGTWGVSTLPLYPVSPVCSESSPHWSLHTQSGKVSHNYWLTKINSHLNYT